jgi:phospholipase/carboxylesterase
MSEFVHRYIPSSKSGVPTLVLLHGTGGDENDLIPLGQMLLPEAAIVSPRGKVLENGMPRFFRRLREGVFDLDDLKERSNELADFLEGYPAPRIAAGFSNGANIAASILLLRPEVFTAAILIRAMVPLTPEQAPDLSEKRVFLSAGLYDPIVPKENIERLADMLRAYGADVTLRWQNAGHQLTNKEIMEARDWARVYSQNRSNV